MKKVYKVENHSGEYQNIVADKKEDAIFNSKYKESEVKKITCIGGKNHGD